MKYILGESKNKILVNTKEKYKDITLMMLEQAQLNIDIFTQNLEPEIYDNTRVRQIIIKLAKRHPKTRIRILVNDSATAVQNGHCLIRLAQQLTSSVFIHTPSLKQEVEQSAFVIVDKTGLITRPLATERNYKASINFKTPRESAKQLEFFDGIWERSTPDIQTRRVYI